jgi:ABC-type oligopeptide transport system ATPase subunit
MTDARALLEITDLVKEYPVRGGILRRKIGTVHAVDGVSFTLGVGETLGLVGESGSMAAISPGSGKPSCGRIGVRCRSSSRIRSPRSIRA